MGRGRKKKGTVERAHGREGEREKKKGFKERRRGERERERPGGEGGVRRRLRAG